MSAPLTYFHYPTEPMLLRKTWVQRPPHVFLCNSISELSYRLEAGRQQWLTFSGPNWCWFERRRNDSDYRRCCHVWYFRGEENPRPIWLGFMQDVTVCQLHFHTSLFLLVFLIRSHSVHSIHVIEFWVWLYHDMWNGTYADSHRCQDFQEWI